MTSLSLTSAIRRRLEALNRGPLSGALAAPRPAMIATSAAAVPLAPTTRPAPAVAEGEVVETPRGNHLRLSVDLDQLWAGARQVEPRAAGARATMAAEEGAWHDELAGLAGALPGRALFLDLETCGFAGAPLFLIGLVRAVEGGLRVEQLLARDYSEEAATLHTLWEAAAASDVLVTFNGKSFDWPMVHDRSTRYHLGRDARQRGGPVGPPQRAVATPRDPADPRPAPLHCDLLHHARRRFKNRLPDCRLQTLETYLCGRRRAGDIPGSRIPDVYHRYVRTGESDELRGVLEHNVLDLVTLVELALLLLEPRPAPHRAGANGGAAHKK